MLNRNATCLVGWLGSILAVATAVGQPPTRNQSAVPVPTTLSTQQKVPQQKVEAPHVLDQAVAPDPEPPQELDDATARQTLSEAILRGAIPISMIPPAVNAGYRRIHAALESFDDFDIADRSIATVARELSARYEIQIHVNASELELLGLAVESPLGLKLSQVRLRSALNLMLEPYELTYMVRNDVLEITSQDSANDNPANEVYRLPIRLSGVAGEHFVALIERVVDPDSWMVNGGTNEIMVFANQLLVVSAPTSTQYKVQELLAKVIDKYGDEIVEPDNAQRR